jgi:hypothetical protein
MGGVELLENSILNSACRNYDIHKYKSNRRFSQQAVTGTLERRYSPFLLP